MKLPTAQEALKESQSITNTKHAKELEKITSEIRTGINKGKVFVTVSNSLSDSVKSYLEEKGYKIIFNAGCQRDPESYTSISWG